MPKCVYLHNLPQELQHLVCHPVKEPQNALKEWYVSVVVFIYKQARASRLSTGEHLFCLVEALGSQQLQPPQTVN
jgi:hypothetical protein